MDRRNFLLGMSALVANGSMLWPSLQKFGDSPSLRTGRPRPNILFLLADDLRSDLLERSSPFFTPTPNIDDAFAKGFNFKNAYVTTSICPSSRASFLSSQYSSKHKIWNFDQSFSKDSWKQTLPAILQRNGYQIAFLGKWGIGQSSYSRNYDYYDGFEGQGNYWQEDGSFLTEALAYRFDNFLEIASQEPWFAQLSFKSPHVQDDSDEPYPIPEEFSSLIPEDEITHPPSLDLFSSMPGFFRDSEGRSRFLNRAMEKNYSEVINRYRAMLRLLDQSVGKIINSLRDRGLLENTILIFASDNGLLLGEYGLGGKWWMFEPSIKIPMKIVLPRSYSNVSANEHSLVLNLDLAPSLLDLLSIPPESSMQGISMFQKMNREAFFYEHQFQEGMQIAPCYGVRSSNFKYFQFPHADFEMLFNMREDPMELNNLASSPEHSRILSQMKSLMISLQKSIHH